MAAEDTDITIEFRRGPSVTIAELTIADASGEAHTFKGDAKRHRGDRPDQVIGDLYALGRAFIAAGEFMTERASGYVDEMNAKRQDDPLGPGWAVEFIDRLLSLMPEEEDTEAS